MNLYNLKTSKYNFTKRNKNIVSITSNEKNYPNERNTCQYYPCHFEGQDCTFCFCPYYPCLDYRTGGKDIFNKVKNKYIWDCSSCLLIHNTAIVNKILDYIMKDEKNIKLSWDEIIIPYLISINKKNK